jgi:hypothetical protein
MHIHKATLQYYDIDIDMKWMARKYYSIICRVYWFILDILYPTRSSAVSMLFFITDRLFCKELKSIRADSTIMATSSCNTRKFGARGNLQTKSRYPYMVNID